jgi:hypothetical protein
MIVDGVDPNACLRIGWGAKHDVHRVLELLRLVLRDAPA